MLAQASSPRSKAALIKVHFPTCFCHSISMSRRLCTALRPTRQCEMHHLRTCAAQRTPFWTDDLRSFLPRHLYSLTPHRDARYFSTTRPWLAKAGRVARPTMQQPAQPSIKVAMERAKQQAVKDGSGTNEAGFLPETFIMPFGKNRPGWFSNYNGRMKLERKRLRARFWDAVG